MFTIFETPTFVEEAAKVWTTEEWLECFTSIASKPDAGVVIPGSGGCRKIRWSRPGMGKHRGVRIIYYTQLDIGEICMLLVYPKSVWDNIPAAILKAIRKEIEDDRGQT